jgi:tRNA A37 methylthiotransferase MiaB
MRTVTYCNIPQLRPTLRSKPIEAAVAEARTLVQAGHKEIILTGIFLGAYGRPTAVRKRFTAQRSPLAALVRAIAEVDGVERLRLSSLEPGDVDGSLLEVLATRRSCVPHPHLPLQSGSERILRRMNRQYTRDAYEHMIDGVRRALDCPAISTDIIVGFPGETESDFEASVEMARGLEFCKIHAFPFSPREKTAAARWQREFVHPAVVRERMRRLAEVERECSLAYRRRLRGCVERVIVEPPDGSPDDLETVEIRHGRADRYVEIHFDTDGQVRTGDLVSVRIDCITPTRTHGTYVNPRVTDYRLPVIPAVQALPSRSKWKRGKIAPPSRDFSVARRFAQAKACGSEGLFIRRLYLDHASRAEPMPSFRAPDGVALGRQVWTEQTGQARRGTRRLRGTPDARSSLWGRPGGEVELLCRR